MASSVRRNRVGENGKNDNEAEDLRNSNSRVVPPKMEPLPHDTNHNPKVLKTWAKRTGFRSTFSGETTISQVSDAEGNNADALPPPPPPLPIGTRRGGGDRNAVDPEAGMVNGVNKEIERVPAAAPPAAVNGVVPPPPGKREKRAVDLEAQKVNPNPRPVQREAEVDVMSQSQDPDDAMLSRQSHMKYELREPPGLVPIFLYGVQHYLSIAGSLVLIPLVLILAMGGSDNDTARVISTMLLVSGVTTLLHSGFGSRLPLIQGGSFVYLAPAVPIVNSLEFQGLNEHTTMGRAKAAMVVWALSIFIFFQISTSTTSEVYNVYMGNKVHDDPDITLAQNHQILTDVHDGRYAWCCFCFSQQEKRAPYNTLLGIFGDAK